jgi:hypothetical protein
MGTTHFMQRVLRGLARVVWRGANEKKQSRSKPRFEPLTEWIVPWRRLWRGGLYTSELEYFRVELMRCETDERKWMCGRELIRSEIIRYQRNDVSSRGLINSRGSAAVLGTGKVPIRHRTQGVPSCSRSWSMDASMDHNSG